MGKKVVLDIVCQVKLVCSEFNLLFQWFQPQCTPSLLEADELPVLTKDLRKIWTTYPQYNDLNTVSQPLCTKFLPNHIR